MVKSSNSRSSSCALRSVVTSAGIVCLRRLEFEMGWRSTEVAVVEAGRVCEVGKVVVLVAAGSYLRQEYSSSQAHRSTAAPVRMDRRPWTKSRNA